MSYIRDNYRNFRRHLRRAVTRPDPYGLPGWVINSDRLAEALMKLFTDDFKLMINAAVARGREIGTFICYCEDEDTLTLGPVYLGTSHAVTVRDCIGFRPIGSFHVHIQTGYKLAFSPLDIKWGLHEFVLAVGGKRVLFEEKLAGSYRLAVLSPYNYWKLPNMQKDLIDVNLEEAETLIMGANEIFAYKPQGWQEIVRDHLKKSDMLMQEVFEMLRMVRVQLKPF